MEVCWSLSGGKSCNHFRQFPTYSFILQTEPHDSARGGFLAHTESGCGKSLPQEGRGAENFCGIKGS